MSVKPNPRKRHCPGWGTCNALLSLGESTYLEIIGPDSAQELDSPPTLVELKMELR